MFTRISKSIKPNTSSVHTASNTLTRNSSTPDWYHVTSRPDDDRTQPWFHRPPLVSAEEAVAGVKTGDTVFVHTACATPLTLTKALTERANEFTDIDVYHMHTEGPAYYVEEDVADSFNVTCFFVGANVRDHCQFVPIFLSEVPRMFTEKHIDLDYALISVSPP